MSTKSLQEEEEEGGEGGKREIREERHLVYVKALGFMVAKHYSWILSGMRNSPLLHSY